METMGGLLGGRRRKEPKKGRRAASGNGSVPSGGGGASEVIAMNAASLSDVVETPPSRRKAGWGDESSQPKRAIDLDDQRFDKVPVDEQNLDDVPVIPDLDDMQEQEIGNQVAAPPSVAGTRLDTFRKLDNELLQQTGLHVLDGDIDLTVLTDLLVPELEVVEEDKHWTWDHLFTEVSSEIHTEWEKGQKHAD